MLQVVLCSLGEYISRYAEEKKIIISDDYDFNNSVSYIHRHMTPVANKSNYLVLVQLDVYY